MGFFIIIHCGVQLTHARVPLGSSGGHGGDWDIVSFCSVLPISVSFCWDALGSVLSAQFLF